MFHLKNIFLLFIFSTGNGLPREPALCQLYRHTFDPYVTRPNHCAKHKTQTTATHVALSVCLCVWWSRLQNGRTDRDAVRGVGRGLVTPKEPCVGLGMHVDAT